MLQTLFERCLNVAHDMGMRSMAFPLTGGGNLGFSAQQVMMAMLDACSLFRMKDSPLMQVIVIVYKYDCVIEEVRVSFARK